MKVIKPYYEIVNVPNGAEVLQRIEQAGRTCYKSEDKITETSAKEFVKRILKLGHHSVIEHESASVRIICDRGVTHEIVRHRLASYSQESTRYANYSHNRFGSEITVIKPCFWDEESQEYKTWFDAMLQAEKAYLSLIEGGASPQEARSVLPNSLKTEIVVTCNLREWRHIFSLRCAKAAHPQMREIMRPLLDEFNSLIPVLFEDLHEQFIVSQPCVDGDKGMIGYDLFCGAGGLSLGAHLAGGGVRSVIISGQFRLQPEAPNDNKKVEPNQVILFEKMQG